MPVLGVNVDHVATLREVRKVVYPSPLLAAKEAVRAGAHQITVHLREDRRHIQEKDVWDLKREIAVSLNLEMAATAEMERFAIKLEPSMVTLVPEKRRELTTEGGLDLRKGERRLAALVNHLHAEGIRVSAFIEAVPLQIRAAKHLGFHRVEFHTGRFCRLYDRRRRFEPSLHRMAEMTRFAKEQGLAVAAGHGIHEHNIEPLLAIQDIEEYNIGHSIVAQAMMLGFYQAVRRMMAIIHAHR